MTLGLVTFLAVLAIGVVRTGIDMEALKARFYPDITIDTSRRRSSGYRDGCRPGPGPSGSTALGEEFETLEASARTAMDIPAKVRGIPAKQPPRGRDGLHRYRWTPPRVPTRKRAVAAPPHRSPA